MRIQLRPKEIFMGELIGLPILEAKEDVVAFGEGLDFAPELSLVKGGIFFHDLDVGEFEFEPTVGGEGTFRRC